MWYNKSNVRRTRTNNALGKTAGRGSASNPRKGDESMDKRKILYMAAFIIFVILLCLALNIKVN